MAGYPGEFGGQSPPAPPYGGQPPPQPGKTLQQLTRSPHKGFSLVFSLTFIPKLAKKRERARGLPRRRSFSVIIIVRCFEYTVHCFCSLCRESSVLSSTKGNVSRCLTGCNISIEFIKLLDMYSFGILGTDGLYLVRFDCHSRPGNHKQFLIFLMGS